ncbi:protein FAR1-RELATED SEQUENCE 6-like [Apium graveolens]|uniref:protein FAR1-RELATED SEQUENCE 6-like n=1 Tax=Apium graveolens TaxID=4045 RepID=UPI003D7AA9D7
MCYESAIKKQNHESKKLTNGETCIPKLVTEKNIEKHAAQVYTRTMFYKVQKQIKFSCFHISLGSQPIAVDGVNKYVVRDRSFDEKYYEVQFKFLESHVECSCKLFTRVGFLCRHCFYILGLWGVERMPYQFLSSRWMRITELRFSKLKFCNKLENGDGSIIRDTSKKIWTEFQGCLGSVSNDNLGLTFMLEGMRSLKISIDEKFHKCAVTKNDILQETFGVRPSGVNKVLPPHQTYTKGSRKRIVSGAELSRDGKKRKLMMCKTCNIKSYHDSRKCPNKLNGQLNKELEHT